MKIIPFSDQAIEEAVQVLQGGGVVAHATETCYGFACDLTNVDAVTKLFMIKNRPTDKPVSALFTAIDQAKEWTDWNAKAEELGAKHLPGPLTLIVPIKEGVEIYPTPAGGNTLGIRISSHEHAQALAKAFGGPLSTTSANLHGKDNPYSAEDIHMQFADQEVQPDIILDAGALPHNPPSTIIDCTGTSQGPIRSGNLKL